jgi:predicted nuclease of predicted toxin-antitoxin system
MKILIDMNLSPSWAAYLAAAGFEAEHWSNVGSWTASDTEIMAWASGRDFVVLTADLDFSAILAANQGTRPSVVQVRNDDLSPLVIGRAVIAAIRQSETELLQGALVSVNTERARARILPLRR